jgi:hypothetical protein
LRILANFFFLFFLKKREVKNLQMSSQLVAPLKKSAQIDFPGSINRFLSNTYSPQEASEYREATKSLAEMRNKVLAAHEASDDILAESIKYWAQLHLLDKRIDFNQVGIAFTWLDAFKGPTTFHPSQGKVVSTTLNLEIASVLFNAAALHMKRGGDVLISKGHFKTASQLFKQAAGMFSGAKDAAAKIDQEPSTDISQVCLTMLETLCLAHAQRCFYEQGKSDKMKDGILSKLASGAANLYSQAASAISGTQAAEKMLKHFKGSPWINELAVEEAEFKAAAHAHAAKALMAEHQGTKKGNELGHYSAAVHVLETAAKLKLEAPARAAKLKTLIEAAKKEHAAAKHDNDKVYHLKEEVAVDPEQRVMVKPEPLPDPQAAVGVDRFSSLVPEAGPQFTCVTSTKVQILSRLLVQASKY